MPPSPSCPRTRHPRRICRRCSARAAIRRPASASGSRSATRSGTRFPSRSAGAAARADRMRPSRGRHDERTRRLPRRRAGRLVRGRAAHRLPAPGRDARAVERPGRGQGRRQRLGGDLLRDPRGLPAPRRQPGARPRGGGFRPRARGPRRSRATRLSSQPGQEFTWGELYVGSRSVFADAGFAEVSRPTLRRAVMRIDF